jgi:TonB-dependent SusC/RagA subfamily outer membrane receptor
MAFYMKWKNILVIIVCICLLRIASGQNSDGKSYKPITITGKVLNAQMEPVGGAVFYIDNIKTSFITKSNGSFKIKVSPSAVKLEVRSPEYGVSETIINERTKIGFTLNGITDNQASDPGAPIKEAGVTDAASKTARPKAKKMNTYTDIYQMIRGEVSGVVVSGKNIQIQQGHSFFGSSEPLFTVNGVIVNSIDNVNPLDVKSISVLKGSAAAIYGVRGANGVISITLINGSEKEK